MVDIDFNFEKEPAPRKRDFVIGEGIVEGVPGDDKDFQIPYNEERDGPRCLDGMSPEAEKEIKKYLIQREIETEQSSSRKTGLIGIAVTVTGAIFGEIINYELGKHGIYPANYVVSAPSIFGLAMSTPGIGILVGNYIASKRDLKDLRTKLSELEKQ